MIARFENDFRNKERPMVVSRTPVRFCIGGGATDIRPYYSRHGGFALSGAVDRFVEVVVKPRLDDKIGVSYLDKALTVDGPKDIPNPIIREALQLLGINGGIEILSLADIPPRSGLGSSGSFGVGLLNALHRFLGEQVTPEQLAREACHIEIDRLKWPSGKQDQYTAAFGGLVAVNIDRQGDVEAEPLRISERGLRKLESNLLAFDTALRRNASSILYNHQKENQLSNKVVKELHNFKKLGLQAKKAIEEGDFTAYGHLLDQLWQCKKSYSAKVTNSRIDYWYEQAMKSGSLRGKVMGAGGGGFFIFYAEGEYRDKLRGRMGRLGLKELTYSFYPRGSEVILNVQT